MGNVFQDIGKGLEWFGEEVEKLVTEVPEKLDKLIVLSEDAAAIASSAAAEVVTLSGDVVGLVAAVKKDDGASLQALETLVSTALQAGADKLVNFTEDAAVVGAATSFLQTLNAANFPDVLAAVSKIIADGKTLSQTVVTDFKKLEADATA